MADAATRRRRQIILERRSARRIDVPPSLMTRSVEDRRRAPARRGPTSISIRTNASGDCRARGTVSGRATRSSTAPSTTRTLPPRGDGRGVAGQCRSRRSASALFVNDALAQGSPADLESIPRASAAVCEGHVRARRQAGLAYARRRSSPRSAAACSAPTTASVRGQARRAHRHPRARARQSRRRARRRRRRARHQSLQERTRRLRNQRTVARRRSRSKPGAPLSRRAASGRACGRRRADAAARDDRVGGPLAEGRRARRRPRARAPPREPRGRRDSSRRRQADLGARRPPAPVRSDVRAFTEQARSAR